MSAQDGNAASTSWWALIHVPTANVLDEQPTREEIEEVMAEFLHTDPGQNPEHFKIVEMS